MKRKISFLLICVMIVTILSSCKGHYSTKSIEKDLRVVNKDDYLSEYVSSTDNMLLYKEKINLSDAYKNIESYDISNVNMPLPDMFPVAVDDLGNVYYANTVDPLINPGPSFIYSYSPKTEKWEKLIETDKYMQCAFISVNDKYIIWQEDENANWLKASIHLYDIKNKLDKKIYTYTRNSEDGLMYSFQFNPPIIINEKLYFEDTVGMKNNAYIIKIFSYDISSQKTTEVASDSKMVMEYKNKPAWLSMSEDKVNCLFYSDYEKGYLFKEITGLGTIFTSKGEMLLANDYMTADDFEKIKEGTAEKLGNNIIGPNSPRSCYGIRKYENDKTIPIVVCSGGFIDSIETNGNIVTWWGTNVGAPIFYDSEIDKIVMLENCFSSDVIAYSTHLSNNYILVQATFNSSTINNDKIMLFKIS